MNILSTFSDPFAGLQPARLRSKGLTVALLGLGLNAALILQAQAAGSLDLLREVRLLDLPGPALHEPAVPRRAPSAKRQNAADSPTPRAPTPGEPTIEIRGLRITGARHLAQADLQAQLADVVGQRLDFSQIQALTRRLRDYYRSRGFEAVEVYVPRQKAHDGVIELLVNEGHVGALQIDTPRPEDVATLRDWTPHLRPGQPLSLGGIEQDLQALAQIDGLSSQVRLEAGEAAGSSDLTLAAHRTRALTGEINYDNTSALVLAPQQISTRLTWLNPGQLGTRLQARLTAGESGLRRLGLDWSELMADGSRFDLTLGWLDFAIDHPMSSEFRINFAPNHQQGRGTQLALQMSKALLRQSGHSQHARARLEVLQTFDQLTSTYSGWANPTSLVPDPTHESYNQDSKSLTVGLEDRRHLEDGLRRTLDLSMTTGVFNGRAISWADAADNQIVGSGYPGLTAQKERPGFYTLLLGRGALSVPAGGRWFFNGRADLQWSTGALPRHEQLRLTGPQGVRAYALDDARADQGLRASVEWRRVTSRFDSYGFADLAWGMAQASADQRQYGAAEWFDRSGAGLGFEMRPTGSTLLSGQLAWKLNASAADRRSPQFWFNLKQSF